MIMEQFCGQRFWDWNLTWHTDSPQLTPCFEDTVLVWIPALFISCLAPLDIYSKWNNHPKLAPSSVCVLNSAKSGLNLFLVLLQLAAVFHSVRLSYSEPRTHPVQFATPFVQATTLSLALFHLQFCSRKGVHLSGTQFWFWFLQCACEAFRFRSWVLNLSGRQAYVVCFPLSAVMLTLNCWANAPPPPEFSESKQLKSCPEGRVSHLSKLTFSWFGPLAWKGWQKPLQHGDLWDLNPADKSEDVTAKFLKHWDKMKRVTTKHKKVSLLPVLFRTLGTSFMVGSVLKACQDVVTFMLPQILKLLIAFVEGNEQQWKGYFYAVLLFIVAMTQTLLNAHYLHTMIIVGMRARSVLVSAIFRKALVLSNSARGSSTVGEIVNLMSVDAVRIQEVMLNISLIWSGPLQIIICFYLLWQLLGPSILAGIALMTLLIPINSFASTQLKKLQVVQMKKKDERVKVVNEVLCGIKVLKLYAWEDSFQQQILKIRKEELQVLRKSAYLRSIIQFTWSCTPFLVSLVTFGTFVLVDETNTLNAQNVFVSLSLFIILRKPLTQFPTLLTDAVQAHVSLQRLVIFLNAQEIDNSAITHNDTAVDQITIQDGWFSWSSNPDTITLRNLNIRIPIGSLCAIVGEIGSGKSSLLAAILGEIEKTSGHVNTKGSIAYVSQVPWVQNLSIKDNILFGLPMNWSSYDKVLESCALRPDLLILPAGDETEIGEKGINLSGGQKQRVSLGRAVYSNADICLLDDPTSAVDSHVGKHIFDHVIGPNGLLKTKTRILVTNEIAYLPVVDFIIVLRGGEIAEQGTYKELLNKNGDFSIFLTRHLEQVNRVANDECDEFPVMHEMTTGTFIDQSSISAHSATSESNKQPAGKTIIKVEESATGNTDARTYMYYSKSMGQLLSFGALIVFGCSEVLGTLSIIRLSEWSNAPLLGTQDTQDRNLYLTTFAVLGTGQVLLVLVGGIVLAYGTLRAAQVLHVDMLTRILRAPSMFFDKTPTGRIINRFGKDVETCDTSLPHALYDFITVILKVLSTFFIISFASRYFAIAVIPTILLYLGVQRFYIATARQLRRLECVSRSPIYSHFSATVNGCAVIRAFNAQERFIVQSEANVDYNQRAYFLTVVANRWANVRLEITANILILIVSIFAVVGRETISPGLVGLSLTYALSLTTLLNVSVRMLSTVETSMVAVERLREYSRIEQEAPAKIAGSKPPKNWPQSGEIKFDGYNTRYRDDLDLVLRDVIVNVNPSEKVGIVGRTGSGKSTFALALFRMLEAAGGSIEIDGVDISKIGLYELRSRITIIPQDPVLFSGTLRINLDPFSQYQHEELWRALELAHLKPFMTQLGGTAGLEYPVSECGHNLSLGQQQLICLARAILRKSRILVLDEATAQIDLDTDKLIQQTIRSEFKDCTVLTIAHRINTIMDYNRVIVMEKGQVREFGTPEALLSDRTTLFYKMVQDAGLIL